MESMAHRGRRERSVVFKLPLLPFISLCHSVPSAIVYRPYCSFVIMECNTPPTLRKEFPVSPAILLRSPSFLDALQVLCWTAHPLQGTRNTPVSNICTGPGEAVIQTKMSQGHIIWWANNMAPLTPRGPYRISLVTIRGLQQKWLKPVYGE